MSDLFPAPGRSDLVSHEVRTRRVLVCRTTRGSLGSPRHLTRSCFHPRDYRLVSPDRSLVIFYDLELILSRCRLFRAPSPLLLARRLSAQASPAWVFGPLRDITRAQPHPRDGSHRHRFVPSTGVLSLPTVCSALGLAGLFHPAATSRVLPFMGFSPRAATLPLRKELPPCRCSDARSPTFAGCRPHRTSASRPSSARGRVRYDAVIHHAARRSPLRVRLLQALTSSVDRSLPAISALDVASPRLRCSRSRAELVLSVSSERSLASRLRFARLLEFSSLLPNLRARDPDSSPVALR